MLCRLHSLTWWSCWPFQKLSWRSVQWPFPVCTLASALPCSPVAEGEHFCDRALQAVVKDYRRLRDEFMSGEKMLFGKVTEKRLGCYSNLQDSWEKEGTSRTWYYAKKCKGEEEGRWAAPLRPARKGGIGRRKTWRQVCEKRLASLLCAASRTRPAVVPAPLQKDTSSSKPSPNTPSLAIWVCELLLQVLLICPKVISHEAERYPNCYNKGRCPIPRPVTCKFKFKYKWVLKNIPNHPQVQVTHSLTL